MASFPDGGRRRRGASPGPTASPTAIVAGRSPKRFDNRIAENAAANEPRAPIENTIPITAADNSSSRTAKTRKMANATLEKKLEVAVQPACARRFGLPRTKRSPSLSSVQRLGLLPSAASRAGGSSCLRMPRRNKPEPRKLIASTSTAYGAVKISTSPPAIPGPPTWAAERLISSFELPSMIWSRSTNEGRYDWYATSKKTLADAGEKDDEVELPERQCVSDVRDRDRGEERRAAEVADDQDRPPAHAVDPDSRRQREEDERQEAEHSDQGDLECAGVELDDGDEADREVVDRSPELADRLRRPQLQKVTMAPEAAARPDRTEIGSSTGDSGSATPGIVAPSSVVRGSSSIGSGISRRCRWGEKRIQRKANPPPIAPNDDRLTQADPRSERAAGERSDRMVPHTMKRITEFMRPCSRGGQIACR